MATQDHPDALFLERLEAFMQKSLLEVKAFSERECRPFEDTRKYVAQWHCKHLFCEGEKTGSRQVSTILGSTSQTLESLHSTAGVHSFLVSINLSNDSWFLGGTSTGREFWRGMRGGGDTGAKTFKNYCLKSEQMKHDGSGSVTRTKKDRGGATASMLKAELYSSVRNALRTASGIHNAEMKWSNHSRLDSYGVTLSGWPADIPKQNPSTLSVSQMKILLDVLEDGRMHFVKEGSTDTVARSDGEADYFSWACEDDQTEHFNPHNVFPPPDQDGMMYLNSPSSPPPTEKDSLRKDIVGTNKRRREDDDDDEKCP